MSRITRPYFKIIAFGFVTGVAALALVWTIQQPNRAVWNSRGEYAFEFGWRSGSVLFRTYGNPMGPVPRGDWVAENQALPPVRRWGWSLCGVTKQFFLCPEGRQETWTLGIPQLLPLAILTRLTAREWIVVRKALRAARQRCGLCPICSYDLRATPRRCPECGWPPPTSATHQNAQFSAEILTKCE